MKSSRMNSEKKPHWFRLMLFAGVFLLQLFPLERVLALDPARDLSQYNCRAWTRQDGLQANGINAIAQTKDGYLWFGTAAGVLRFDGVEFKLCDLYSVANVRNSCVTSLASGHSGGLWGGVGAQIVWIL